jgi:transcriptional regulator with XRE-family HTH domain
MGAGTIMTRLGQWLLAQMRRRDLTQNATAIHTGVGVATISDILNKGHVPKVETLFRLADYFDTPHAKVLRLAGHLPAEEVGDDDDALVQELIDEFRKVPDGWKEVAIQQVAQFRKLAELRPMRIIGDEEEDDEQAGTPAGAPRSDDAQTEKAQAA